MAKKKQRVRYIFDCHFKVMVPPDLVSVFSTQLKKGEISISTDVFAGDLSFYQLIYPDQIAAGQWKMAPVLDSFSISHLSGSFIRDLDKNFEPDLDFAAALQKGTIEVISRYVRDLESNEYYFDGDKTKTIKIGIAELA
jgi:hypothetical protein